jgi:hypothetical protein
MTERTRSSRSAAVRTFGLGTVAWAAGALFLSLLALLAVRVSSGDDPALRAWAAAHAKPRRVLVRKVYEKRVVVHLPAGAPPQSASSSTQVGAAGAFGSYPLTRSS